jgi:hypothetical protein
MSNDFVPDPRREAAAKLHAEMLMQNMFWFTLIGAVLFISASAYVLFQ